MRRFTLLGMIGIIVANSAYALSADGGAGRAGVTRADLPQADQAMLQATTRPETTYADAPGDTTTTTKTTPIAVQTPRSLYINIGGGLDIPRHNTTSTLPSNTPTYSPTPAGTGVFQLDPVSWQNKYQQGYEANIALGSVISPRWRMEAEFLYQNLLRKVNGSYNFKQLSSTSGNVYADSFNNAIGQTSTRSKVYSLLANGYYDFRNKSKWTPLLGAGIGVAWIRSPKTTANGTLTITDVTAATTSVTSTTASSPMLSGAAFAYQLKAGVSYEVTKYTSLALQYRFFGTSEFQASTSSIRTGATTFSIGQQNTSNLRTNSLDLSLRYLIS